MATPRPQRRAERRARNQKTPMQVLGLNEMDALNFDKAELGNYISMMKQIKAGTTTLPQLTDKEKLLFLRFQMDPPDEAALASLAKKEGDMTVEEIKQLNNEMIKMAGTPEYRNQMLNLSKKVDLANKNTAFSNAMGLLLAAGDVTRGQQQIQEFKRRAKELQRPTRPGPMPADPYLDAAKKAAERGTYGESIAAKAARQQAFDAYQQDIQNAAIASTGQAGGFGALAQTATTRLGRRGAEMAPQIEAIRQGREQQRAQMAGLSSQENAARYESMAKMYPYDLAMYQKEAQAVGELGAAGRQNVRTGMYEMRDYLPGMAAQAFVNRQYNPLKEALISRGMSEAQATKFSSMPPAREYGLPKYDVSNLPKRMGSPGIPDYMRPAQGFQAGAEAIAPGQAYPTVPLNQQYSPMTGEAAMRARLNTPSSGFSNWPTADQLRQQYPLEQFPEDTADYMNAVPQKARRYKNPYQ